jgi:hypothetical protein
MLPINGAAFMFPTCAVLKRYGGGKKKLASIVAMIVSQAIRVP